MDTLKNCNQKNPYDSSTKRKKVKHGSTSTHLHPPELVFKYIDIPNGTYFLDLGCGIGEYSIFASPLVGESGKIFAYDITEKVIEDLKGEISILGLSNIDAQLADITKSLPLKDNSVDICFMATVLHTLNLKENKHKVFNEIYRILKPAGKLITIDCKKELIHFGPPQHLRLSPPELVKMANEFDFECLKYTDLGYNYMLQFKPLKQILL